MITITSRTEIDRLFAGGRRVTHPALLVLALPSPPECSMEGRVVFAAGTRLGTAIIRNRSKRVLRELVRRHGGPWPGWDMALIARAQTATAEPATLDAALDRALQALGITS